MNDVKGQSAILSAVGFTILLVSIIGDLKMSGFKQN